MKVAHTADWHLMDSQMGRKERGDDFTAAAELAIRLAAKEGAKVIVNSGDLFNVPRPSARKLGELQQLDKLIGALGMQMLLVSGNHDKSEPSWIDVARLEHTHNLDNNTLEIDGVKFTGIPFMPAPQLKAAMASLPVGDVLVLHCGVRELMGFPSKEAVTLDDLPTKAFSAIMLGDIHIHDYVEIEKCHVGYPGSIELCSRAEPFIKHLGMFTFDDKGSVIGRESVPIVGTRPVMEFRVGDPDAADRAVDEISQARTTPPLIYLHYRQDMTEVIPRARAAMMEGGIFKPLPIPKIKAGRYGEAPADLPDLSRPQDFVSDFLPAETGVHELALRCCAPGAPTDVLIAEYIAERLKR